MTDEEAITQLVKAIDKTGLIIEALLSYVQLRLVGYTPEESYSIYWDL